jgi:hypothetical protein
MLASLSICARRPTAVDQRKSFAAPTSMIQLPTEGSPQNTEMATVDAAPHWQASPPVPIMMVRGPRRRGARDDSGASGRTSISPSLAGRHPPAAARGLEGGCKGPGPPSQIQVLAAAPWAITRQSPLGSSPTAGPTPTPKLYLNLGLSHLQTTLFFQTTTLCKNAENGFSRGVRRRKAFLSQTASALLAPYLGG